MKKVLAWAVALALVLSSFTMAFAADTANSSQFKDADQINYTEAVDVMVATGVINGYPDGTFGPQKTVKRSEMAKMISVMLNAGKDIGDQYKDACTFADSKDHWAAGYIAYCAAQHIIDGRSADVFDPEKEVTGTEVAKMALTSLGYDSKIQGYTGEQWAANVLKDANKIDLFEGLDSSFVPGEPCSREAAAQILFNALQATKVEYTSGTSVSVGDDVSVTVDAKIQDVTKPASKDQQANKDDGTPGKGTIQLWEDVFGKDLQKTDKNADDFGRPAHEWQYKDDSVGVYSDSADDEFIAEKADIMEAIKAHDEALAKDLTKNKITPTVTINGQTPNGQEYKLGVGDKVELYNVDLKAGTCDAIVTQYKPAQITKVNTKVSDSEKEDGITAKLTLKGAITKADNKMAGYDESAYVEDAVIAVAVGKDEKGQAVVLDSYPAKELVKGTVTKIKGSTVTIDGTAYDPSGVFVPFDGGFEIDNNYTVYDYNGYMFASLLNQAADPEEFYGILLEVGENTGTFSSDTTKVFKVFTAEGKEANLAKAGTDDFTGTDTFQVKTKPEVLVKYTKNDDDAITSIVEATEAGFTNKTMKTNGVINAKAVAEDVVAFAKDGEDWIAYGFADLEKADSITATKVFSNKDGELVAMKLEGNLEETTNTLGIITKAEWSKTADGWACEITALVAGNEEHYTTISKKVDTAAEHPLYDSISKLYVTTANASENNPAYPKSAALAKFEFNDEKVSAVEFADCFAVAELADSFNAGTDAVFLSKNPAATVVYPDGVFTAKEVKGNSIDIGFAYENNTWVEGKGFQDCTGAVVYELTNDDVVISSIEEIGENANVILLQTSKDSSAWNIVIWQEAPATSGSPS